MGAVTAHCIVKNEEVYIEAAIRSVIDFVDTVIAYDTGSNDQTVAIIKKLQQEFPAKIVFEEKGVCDKKRHTQLRQEMLERTNTDWFMVLDGDEVWTAAGMREAFMVIENMSEIECIMAPFYLCVGDIYHRYYRKGQIQMLGRKDFFYPRLIKKVRGVHWHGDYNQDTIVDSGNAVFFNQENSYILKSHYWHLTHLRRSASDDADYSSGGTRLTKRKLTYFFIGRKIRESVPEAFQNQQKQALSFLDSLVNFFKLIKQSL